MTPADKPPTDDAAEIPGDDRAHFRRTFVRVMTVQVLALLALWLLQSRYSP